MRAPPGVVVDTPMLAATRVREFRAAVEAVEPLAVAGGHGRVLTRHYNAVRLLSGSELGFGLGETGFGVLAGVGWSGHCSSSATSSSSGNRQSLHCSG